MITPITATFPALNFPKEVNYPTQEDWAAFSAAAELNYGILSGEWSLKSELYKNQMNTLALQIQDIGNNAITAITLDTVDDLATYTGTGLVMVKDLNRGGTFIYDATQSAVNNGGTIFNGWVRQYSGAVNVKWFGAVGDGVTDDTAACNAAIDYVSNNRGGSVYAPASVYLLGDLKEKIYATSGLLAGYNSWALLYTRSNVTFYGDGNNTVLKAANGLVATNAHMIGTKGYQVFVHEDYQTPVNNFIVKNLKVDFNGLNNLMKPMNGYGNQSLVHGIYIETGSGCGVEGVTWVNHPGHQIVNFQYSTDGCFVRNCVFSNNGWLEGINSLLTDHSSIYCAGTNWSVEDNYFTQPDIVPVGAAYELHGTGRAARNYSENYAGISNVACIVGEKNANIELLYNISRNTGGGVGVYRIGSDRSLKLTLIGNDYQLNGKPATAFPLIGSFKQMINAGEATVPVDGGITIINSYNNIYSVASHEWSPGPDDLLSVPFVSHGVNGYFKGDTFEGFRGPIVKLQRAQSGQAVSFETCTFKGCGRSNEFTTNNAIVNYTNSNTDSHGTRLYGLDFIGNSFSESCSYAAYLSIQQEAGGFAMTPERFTIYNDIVKGWIPPTVGLSNIPSVEFKFEYSCKGSIDLNKPLADGNAIATYSTGKINVLHNGWYHQFSTGYGLSQWNVKIDGYDSTPPSVARPFGDRIGDRYDVTFITGGNSPVQFICTASGVGSGFGTWRPLLLN